MSQERYKRQLSLIGESGQAKLKDTLVTIVGAGALGNIATKFLASTGVGNIIIIDPDIIDKSNLNRQILFNEEAIGKSKAYGLLRTLQKINSDIEYKAIQIKLTGENIRDLINPDYVRIILERDIIRF